MVWEKISGRASQRAGPPVWRVDDNQTHYPHRSPPMTSSLTRSAVCLLTALAGATTAAAQQPLLMEKYTVRDPMAVHQDAVTFLKPKGWTVSGGIRRFRVSARWGGTIR